MVVEMIIGPVPTTRKHLTENLPVRSNDGVVPIQDELLARAALKTLGECTQARRTSTARLVAGSVHLNSDRHLRDRTKNHLPPLIALLREMDRALACYQISLKTPPDVMHVSRPYVDGSHRVAFDLRLVDEYPIGARQVSNTRATRLESALRRSHSMQDTQPATSVPSSAAWRRRM